VDGVFPDEVWHMAAVDRDTDGIHYHVHQAGAYQREDSLRKDPFFSPSLAKYCDESGCQFASWGTMAHTPTNYTSHVLYYTRYQDCGNGVLEATWSFHNGATATNNIDYLNTAMSLRVSSLTSMMQSLDKNSDALSNRYPMGIFGAASQYHLMSQTGGYTAFTQGIKVDGLTYALPCGTGTVSKGNCVPIRLIVNGRFVRQTGISAAWGSDVFQIQIQNQVALADACIGENLNFIIVNNLLKHEGRYII
jgi:hypothetical protein